MVIKTKEEYVSMMSSHRREEHELYLRFEGRLKALLQEYQEHQQLTRAHIEKEEQFATVRRTSMVVTTSVARNSEYSA